MAQATLLLRATAAAAPVMQMRKIMSDCGLRGARRWRGCAQRWRGMAAGEELIPTGVKLLLRCVLSGLALCTSAAAPACCCSFPLLDYILPIYG